MADFQNGSPARRKEMKKLVRLRRLREFQEVFGDEE